MFLHYSWWDGCDYVLNCFDTEKQEHVVVSRRGDCYIRIVD